VKVKKADGNARPAGLDGWRTGGNLRKEWLKRDKQGKEEMAYLTTNWAQLQGPDFISIKARLQV